jgi:hypothetical protein
MKRPNNDIVAYRESSFFSVGSILHKKIGTWTTVFVHAVIFIATWQQSRFASPPSANYKLPLSFSAFCIYFLAFVSWDVLVKKDTPAFIFSTKHIR